MFANTTHCSVKKKSVYVRSALVAAAASPPSAAPPSIEAPTPAQRLLYLTRYFLIKLPVNPDPEATSLCRYPKRFTRLCTVFVDTAFHTVRIFFFADFAVCDWCHYCKASDDVKFFQIVRNRGKWYNTVLYLLFQEPQQWPGVSQKSKNWTKIIILIYIESFTRKSCTATWIV